MSLPYRWRPLGVILKHSLEPGDVLPWDHEVYRVIDVREHPEHQDRPVKVILRPVKLGDDILDRNHDLALGAPRHWIWDVYPDPQHYPVCGNCGDPMPCRELMAAQVSAEAGKRMDRYSMPSVCPACSEPLTERQKTITFEENLEVPGGPPVTFHLRRSCWGSAQSYENRWHRLDPENRRRQLSCDGHFTNHNDGTYECTAWPECPGPQAPHRSYSVCDCPDCHARGPFGCHPPQDARHVDRRIP